MNITTHNILAVVCGTLLMMLTSLSAAADSQYSHPGYSRDAEHSSQANTRNRNQPAKQRMAQARDSQKANDRKNPQTPRKDNSSGNESGVSRDEAAGIAARSTGGRVLSVRDKGRYWEVKVLVDEQRVRYVNVDRRTGRVQ